MQSPAKSTAKTKPKAYIAFAISNRPTLNTVILAIENVLGKHEISSRAFANEYQFKPTGEKEMMRQALAAIDECDLLIAELSVKAIGVGIELGYARAKNKTIIYLRKDGSEASTTAEGICDYEIVYHAETDLAEQLDSLLGKI